MMLKLNGRCAWWPADEPERQLDRKATAIFDGDYIRVDAECTEDGGIWSGRLPVGRKFDRAQMRARDGQIVPVSGEWVLKNDAWTLRARWQQHGVEWVFVLDLFPADDDLA